jgi:hypothetical protein
MNLPQEEFNKLTDCIFIGKHPSVDRKMFLIYWLVRRNEITELRAYTVGCIEGEEHESFHKLLQCVVDSNDIIESIGIVSPHESGIPKEYKDVIVKYDPLQLLQLSVKQPMPLTKKGKKIEKAMDKEYGKKKGKQVFYASKNAGKIKGVEGRKKRR